jgi:hypothetical protein
VVIDTAQFLAFAGALMNRSPPTLKRFAVKRRLDSHQFSSAGNGWRIVS